MALEERAIANFQVLTNLNTLVAITGVILYNRGIWTAW